MNGKMAKLTRVLLAFFLMLLSQFAAQAQNEVEMADTMRSNGKIFVIVAIILIVLAGLILYLFLLDRKISRLEKEIHNKS